MLSRFFLSIVKIVLVNQKFVAMNSIL